MPDPQASGAADLKTSVGSIPYRIALAGGWIDQPFVSCRNPSPPGSMVVVGLNPVSHFMDRAGFATGTRAVARRLWNDALPSRDPAALVRELYEAENASKAEPSGSQDMIGLIYPGINRLDYDYAANGGVFPVHVETLRDRAAERWLEQVLHVLPVAQRPDGYNPLAEKKLEPKWIGRLGQSGQDCFAGIARRDLRLLGRSMNETMACWEAILPHTVRHPTLQVDLKALLADYQRAYPGAMYSGCGGGYLIVASETSVPGALKVSIRTAQA